MVMFVVVLGLILTIL